MLRDLSLLFVLYMGIKIFLVLFWMWYSDRRPLVFCLCTMTTETVVIGKFCNFETISIYRDLYIYIISKLQNFQWQMEIQRSKTIIFGKTWGWLLYRRWTRGRERRSWTCSQFLFLNNMWKVLNLPLSSIMVDCRLLAWLRWRSCIWFTRLPTRSSLLLI